MVSWYTDAKTILLNINTHWIQATGTERRIRDLNNGDHNYKIKNCHTTRTGNWS